MKVRTNLSYIQTMMRDSMEEILVSLPYCNKKFTRLFRKILNCCMRALVRAGGKNLLRNSFRISSHVKIELGARE